MVSKASQGGLSSWCWISALGFPMWCLNSPFSLERIPKLMMSPSSLGYLQGMWVPTRLLLVPCYPSQSVFFFFLLYILHSRRYMLFFSLFSERIVLQILITLVCSWEKVNLEFSYSTILMSFTNLYFNIVHSSISPFYS